MASTLKTQGIIGLLAAALLVGGCGKEEPAQETSGAQQTTDSSTPTPNMADSAEQTRQALAQMNQGKTIEALTPAAIKEFLPVELSGFKRTDASSQRNQMGGVDLSVAEARYEATDGNGSIDVTITDVRNLSGSMKLGMAGWAMAQYNRETDTGYEKTTTFSGYKAIEEYDNETKAGALRIFLNDRFIVGVEGRDVAMDAIKQAMGKIDLKKLAAVK